LKQLIIDIGRLERRLGRATPTGVDRVILAYADHLKDRYPGQVVFTRSLFGIPVAYSKGQAETLLSLTATNWATGQQNGFSRMSRIWMAIRDSIASFAGPRRLGGNGQVYFTLDHNGLEENGPVRRMHQTGSQIVAFLHDLIPLSHPEYVVPHSIPKHRQRMAQMSACADLVIANSAYTQGEFESYLKRQNLAVPDTVAAHLGIEDTWRDNDDASNSSAPYFVVLGTIEARKNHLLLLNAWRELEARLGPDTPKLYVVGRRGWEAECVEDMLERCPALQGIVVERPSLADDELRHLLTGARALLFPSHVEGFGLPLAEALASGIPVIASDIPVFREIAGDIPEYRSTIDGIGWLDAVEAYSLPGSTARAEQLKRLRNFKPTYWDDHFRTLDKALAKLIGDPAQPGG